MISYTTKLILTQEQNLALIALLAAQRLVFNECSKIKFEKVPKNSIVDLHKEFYSNFRKSQAEIPAQIVISAEQECLSRYRSIKSNKHKLNKPLEKKRLSLRLDKRSYSWKRGEFSIISLGKRIKCKPYLYSKLQELIKQYRFCDPQIFERNGEVWIALTFDNPVPLVNESSACGVDLGKRMAAVTSEGNFYRDKKFNKEQRKLRFLKRKLQSKGTKSSRRHLKKLRRKEKNKNKNQSHILANAILRNCKANVVIIEDLKGIKKKKSKFENKNYISQVPFYQLKQILTYKAPLYGKLLISVNPAYTSQIDHRTEKADGKREGRRYYGKDGIVLDADQNAAINIAKRSKLPVSYVTVLDGQAKINSPIVYKSKVANAAIV